MNFKRLFLIQIVMLIALIVLFAIFGRYEEPHCGDGICNEDELNNCDIDCATICQANGEDIEISCSVGWNSTYINLVNIGLIKREWLTETTQLDFSNPLVQQLATSLKRDNPKETIKATAQWVYEHIVYDGADTYRDCDGVKASEVLARKSGVCSTMSKLNIALLRANGIPAYSETGCWNYNTACNNIQTFWSDLKFKPNFVEIKVDESGYAPTMGYLHNWVVVPLYLDDVFEYVIVESTSGRLYGSACVNYETYYSDPSDSLACGLSEYNPNVKKCQEW